MIDDRTSNLNLPLPHESNSLEEDVDRLRSALTTIDAEIEDRDPAPLKGQPNGYAPLDSGGKVPSAHLPAYVDDVLEYAAIGSFPGVGEAGKIYVATDTNKTYRWSGSVYIEVSPGPGTTDAVLEGSVNRYFTEQRARDAQLPATGVSLGVVKVGSGLSVSGDGTIAVAGGGGGSGLPVFNELVITPSSNGQTAFAPAGGYVAGQIELYLNGVLLVGNGDDYTASDGTNITLVQGVNTVDTLLLRRWLALPEAVAVNKTGDTMTGALNESAAVNVASGSTVDIGTFNRDTLNITGTTSITSLGTAAAGVKRTLVFQGALTFTHSAALSLPGAANITTAAGDTAEVISLGSGNWRCEHYTRASGLPISQHNPTLTGAVALNGSVRSVVTPVAALAIDCSLGNYFTKTINGASEFSFSNVPSGAYACTLELTHTSGTVTWPLAVKWPGDVAPTLATGKTHLFFFVTDDGGARWRAAALPNYTS